MVLKKFWNLPDFQESEHQKEGEIARRTLWRLGRCAANPPNFRSLSFDPPARFWEVAIGSVDFESIRPIVFGLCRSRSFFDEALIADSSSILQGEIDPSSRVNFGSAFSAQFGSRFAHCFGLKVFFI